MDGLRGFTVFVQVAESGSLVAAGRMLGVSASAVGKSVARLEERLGVRLFHRTTRSINLTAEGHIFLERSRRILADIEAAEHEISHARQAPAGRLRVSLPLVGELLYPVMTAFMRAYPDIELDLDFTDRLVDVVEEGFDAVVRIGEPSDSRLIAKFLGSFRLILVASPEYLRSQGVPCLPRDLKRHQCLQYKYPTTGRVQKWPLKWEDEDGGVHLPANLTCNTIETLIYAAIQGLGITCLPDFSVYQALNNGSLQTVLPEHANHVGTFRVMWPTSKHVPSKLRVFIDFLSERMFRADGSLFRAQFTSAA